MIWGVSDLSKELVPAWNVSMKGNVTFDAAFSTNFHNIDNQNYMKAKCDELRTVKGVTPNFDKDKRDISV